MLPPIFADDAPLDARREAAYKRLIGLCPVGMRPMFAGVLRAQVSQLTDEQLGALMLDVDGVLQKLEAGDTAGALSTAQKYGATEAQIRAFLPEYIPHAGSEAPARGPQDAN